MRGCFVILLPNDSDFKPLGSFLKDDGTKFDITSDLFLRLNLDHSKNEFNLLKVKDLSIFSYIRKFKGRLRQKASGIIVGLLLDESDNPEEFRYSLKEASGIIEGMDLFNISKEDFEAKLKEIYEEYLETLIGILDPNVLKESIINRTKEMLSGDKKQRKVVQDLLQKVEDNVPAKISVYYRKAEEAVKALDHEKAAKLYNKAADVATDLLEEDLAKVLREKAIFSQKIPELLKTRDKIVQEARNALKNEDFHSAYLSYRKASEISKLLFQFEKEEEYRLKSKALDDFYQVDQRFKQKK